MKAKLTSVALCSYGSKLNTSKPMQTLALPREILFHLLMNAPEGVPLGGSTSPLIRPTTGSAFMLRNNLLERGLPLQLDIPRSPAPGPVGCTAPPCCPFHSLFLCFYNFLLIIERLIAQLQTWLDRNEGLVLAPNITLMALFSLAWL